MIILRRGDFMDNEMLEGMYEDCKDKEIKLDDLRSKTFKVLFVKSIMNISVFGHKKQIDANLEGYNLIAWKKIMYFSISKDDKGVMILYDDRRNPHKMRNFIDRIVQVSPRAYLGKLFQKRGGVEKFICFFWLEELEDANAV